MLLGLECSWRCEKKSRFRIAIVSEHNFATLRFEGAGSSQQLLLMHWRLFFSHDPDRGLGETSLALRPAPSHALKLGASDGHPISSACATSNPATLTDDRIHNSEVFIAHCQIKPSRKGWSQKLFIAKIIWIAKAVLLIETLAHHMAVGDKKAWCGASSELVLMKIV